ncbi:MAG: GAP family protein [Gordonia sp. (in: high G+C Gram-positive bacteria)]|uniref:GAP family protein n=1 Tax=Gordonia sp. (in: high G+C Gram-positive bacteria) TaxID=84139 RepID=UPI003BB6593E
MGPLVGELLPLGLGVAISPIPIIAAILMLLGQHARTTSVGFALGWVTGIVAVTVLLVYLSGAIAGDGGSHSQVAWLKLVIGVLLVALGVRNWRGRDGAATTPKWMSTIDSLRPIAGFGMGLALAAVNPKNLLLCVGAGTAIGTAGLTGGDEAVAIVVFSAIAAASVLGPVLAYQIAADRLAAPLDRLRAWLQEHNQAVMAVLLLVLGVTLFGQGLGGLLAV